MNNTPVLNSESHSPLYQQLIRQLRRDIALGNYPVHSRIPSEAELCNRYKVSRVTVRKALLTLCQEGQLTRRQGKGTFVAIPRIRKDLGEITSFSDACQMMGMKAFTRLLHAQLTEPTAEEEALFGLTPDQQLIEIKRLRCADDMPVILETNHFAPSFDFLLREDLCQSLYATLKTYGFEPTQAVHDIDLCYATPTQAKQLTIEPGDALLRLAETVYDQNGVILHTSLQLIRGNHFTFRI